ncbi:polysaccharide lyase family 14 protein [Mycena crocata]|nr:polysaccharide lyase family 14 protein [Mycena crocata]
MFLGVLLSAFALSLLCGLALCVPLQDNNYTTSLVWPREAADEELLITQGAVGTVFDAVTSLLLAPAHIIAELPSPPPAATGDDTAPLYLFPPYSPIPGAETSQSAAPSTTTATETLTDTETLTEPPTTITLSATPSTVTDIVTVFIPTSPPAPSSASTTPGPSSSKTAWAAPAQMTDLSAFNITAFPGGQQNLKLPNGIPASASASSTPVLGLDALIQPSPAPYIAWNNATTVMQLLYPANSVNPAAKPQGGAEFYCTPLAIAAAQTVTLIYSVFFPDDFDWVKAGKLPGLYGGHTGCSGGNAALDCFSTRLMWRQRGQGELYLYAARDKQTDALCSHPQSVCGSTYGISIGRGSFRWRAGGWTTISQTVQLNTPGEQDGGFWLDIDGRRVIQRTDIYYRDAPSSETTKVKPPPKSSSTTSTSAPPDDGGDGALLPLGPLLGGLLSMREFPTNLPPMASSLQPGVVALPGDKQWELQLTLAQETTATSTVSATATLYPTLAPASEQAALPILVGFIGIFFSTFFGGHGPQYATPRDQYVWFKDFGVIYNR